MGIQNELAIYLELRSKVFSSKDFLVSSNRVWSDPGTHEYERSKPPGHYLQQIGTRNSLATREGELLSRNQRKVNNVK